MSSEPPRSSDPGDTSSEIETYRRAALEARAQAEALRRAVVQADALVGRLEELVESLLAILEYPKAYDWPPLPSEEDLLTEERAEVSVVVEPDERIGPSA